MFPDKDVHKYRSMSPDVQHRNQFDHVAVRFQSVEDTRDFRGADVASDNALVITGTKIKLNSRGRKKKQNRGDF